MEGSFVMGGKSKYSPEERIAAVQKYLASDSSLSAFARQYGISFNNFKQWVFNYESMGAEAFIEHQYKRYSKAEKETAVIAYLNGEGSYLEICKKYGIRSTRQLGNWIKKYNGHEELKNSGTGGIFIMTKGRKTTFEERVEIASYCISCNHNYSKTADKFSVSYQQARNYTVKYEDGGLDALRDRRGKRKEQDAFTEVDLLKAELKLEKAKRKQAEMEASFLKKLKEIERRWD